MSSLSLLILILMADHSNRNIRYWIVFSVVGVIVAFLVFRAMIRLNHKIYLIRKEFWPTVKLIFRVAVGIAALIGLAILAINMFGRQQEKRKKQNDNE